MSHTKDRLRYAGDGYIVDQNEETVCIVAIRKAREYQDSALLHTSYRVWLQWESGDRRIHPAFWELFQRKTGEKNMKFVELDYALRNADTDPQEFSNKTGYVVILDEDAANTGCCFFVVKGYSATEAEAQYIADGGTVSAIYEPK